VPFKYLKEYENNLYSKIVSDKMGRSKMKFPDKITKFCPVCNTYTEHKVRLETVRKVRRKLSKGQRRAERRSKGHGNHGRYSKKPISQWKMRAKTTRKIDLILTCTTCGKSRHMSLRRMKRFEIVKV